MAARWNPTQAELNRASALRALEAMELSAELRDAIRPIRARRFAKLAALIEATPAPERRTDNRRARRDGR
jgi:hypothetical protein